METEIIEGGVSVEGKEEEVSVGTPAGCLAVSVRGIDPLLAGPAASLPDPHHTAHTGSEHPPSPGAHSHQADPAPLRPTNPRGHAHRDVPHDEVCVGGRARHEVISTGAPGDGCHGDVIGRCLNPDPGGEKSKIKTKPFGTISTAYSESEMSWSYQN